MTIGHVVLENGDGARIFDLNASDFIEGDGVPVADDADFFALLIVEECGCGGLATTD